MKIIFDFDDVLFDAELFKKKVFSGLQKFGISEEIVEASYQKYAKAFNARKLYEEVAISSQLSISEEDIQEAYDNLLKDLTGYVDKRLVDLIHKLGKENCFILSAGDNDFQRNKIQSSGASDIISDNQTIIVSDDKSERIKYICDLYNNESVIFIDDKKRHIEDAASLKVKNLFPVLYDELGFEALNETIKFCNENEEKEKRDKEIKQGVGLPMR